MPLNRTEAATIKDQAAGRLDSASRESVYVAYIRDLQYFGQDDGDGQIAGTYRETPILGCVYWCDIDGVLGSVLLLATPVASEVDATIVVASPVELKDLTSLSVLPFGDPESGDNVAIATNDVEQASSVIDPDFRRFVLSRGRWSKKGGPEAPSWFEVHAHHALIRCLLPGSADELQHQLDALIEFRAHLLRRGN